MSDWPEPRIVPTGVQTSHGIIRGRFYELEANGVRIFVDADTIERAIYNGDGRRLIVRLKDGVAHFGQMPDIGDDVKGGGAV